MSRFIYPESVLTFVSRTSNRDRRWRITPVTLSEFQSLAQEAQRRKSGEQKTERAEEVVQSVCTTVG